MCVYHSVPTASNNDKPAYYLKESAGKLAVYEAGSDVPREIFDTDISIFPEEDIKKLKEGIPAYTKEELSELIEDFSG